MSLLVSISGNGRRLRFRDPKDVLLLDLWRFMAIDAIQRELVTDAYVEARRLESFRAFPMTKTLEATLAERLRQARRETRDEFDYERFPLFEDLDWFIDPVFPSLWEAAIQGLTTCLGRMDSRISRHLANNLRRLEDEFLRPFPEGIARDAMSPTDALAIVTDRQRNVVVAFAYLGYLPKEQHLIWHALRKSVPQLLTREFSVAKMFLACVTTFAAHLGSKRVGPCVRSAFGFGPTTKLCQDMTVHGLANVDTRPEDYANYFGDLKIETMLDSPVDETEDMVANYKRGRFDDPQYDPLYMHENRLGFTQMVFSVTPAAAPVGQTANKRQKFA